jgi:urease accessory protein
MYDAASLSDAPVLQRAVGELRIEVRRREGATALDGLRQAGCLKARFPRRDTPRRMDAITLNTSGGVAGGDSLDSSFVLGEGACLTVASQAAERFYRALPNSAPARVNNHVVVGAGGEMEWLPQETILFDGCALRRRLRIDLAADARFLGVESLTFGRAAMGETVRHASLRDGLELRRDGRLLLHDVIRLEGDVAATLQRPAVAAGARAVATLLYVADDAEAMLAPLRGLAIGASSWDGMLIARILGADGAGVRATVIAALRVLRDGRAPPRAWMC